MHEKITEILFCLKCQSEYKTFIDQGSQELIKKGSLICENCNETIPIVNDIPRFTFKKKI